MQQPEKNGVRRSPFAVRRSANQSGQRGGFKGDEEALLRTVNCEP